MKGKGSNLRPRALKKCPYSASCFTCTFRDCVAGKAYRYNTLPTDWGILGSLGGDRA